jgi:hypothetical protein
VKKATEVYPCPDVDTAGTQVGRHPVPQPRPGELAALDGPQHRRARAEQCGQQRLRRVLPRTEDARCFASRLACRPGSVSTG